MRRRKGGTLAEFKDYDLDPFDWIDISSGLRAVVHLGERQSVRIECTRPNQIDKCKVKVVNSRLRVRRRTDLVDILLGRLFNPTKTGRGITVHVTVPYLLGVKASIGADINVDSAAGDTVEVGVSTGARITIGAARADTLHLTCSTAGRLSIAGVCENLEMKFFSGSNVSAIELACTNAIINGNNGSVAELTVIGSVSGTLKNGCTVHCIGRPHLVDVKTVGGSTLTFG